MPLLEVLRKKLREVRYFLGEMNAIAQRVVGDPEEFEFLLSALLSASRSITDRLERTRPYGSWFQTWGNNRTAREQELLEFMCVQRNAEVHRDGADVQQTVQYVPITEIRTGHQGHCAYGFHWWAPPGTPPPAVGLIVRQFELGGTRLEAFVTCRDFVQVLGELVSAFETDNPGV